MDKPTTKPLGRLQGKIVARLCNQLLENSSLIVRNWQLPGTNPLPKHRRFTLETLDGDDWDEILCIYELHQELQHDEEEKTQATG